MPDVDECTYPGIWSTAMNTGIPMCRLAALLTTTVVALGQAAPRKAIAQRPAAQRPAAPDPFSTAPARVPIGANFSRLELVTIGVATAAGIVMMAFGTRVFGAPAPSLGPPDPESFDRRWADRLHTDNGTGGRFLARIPDVTGMFVNPYLPALAYGIDVVAIGRTGTPWLTRDPNPDHRLAAYTEAIGWTLLATGITKTLVGRQRPYVVLNHPELAGSPDERNLSFFSGHSAVMFAAASFIALDVSRRLQDGPLASASPARRWLEGAALPYFFAYGPAALVAVSRVIDQQHWPSDVLIGALVGTGIGHAAYLAHFDDRGRPRGPDPSYTPSPMSVHVSPTPNGVALVGAFP